MPEGSKPMGAVASPDGKRIYVSNGRGGTVSVIDVAIRLGHRVACRWEAALGHRAHAGRPEALHGQRAVQRRQRGGHRPAHRDEEDPGRQDPVGRGARAGAVTRALGAAGAARAAARGRARRPGPEALAVDAGRAGGVRALWSASVAAGPSGWPAWRAWWTGTRSGSPGSSPWRPAPIPWPCRRRPRSRPAARPRGRERCTPTSRSTADQRALRPVLRRGPRASC